MANIIRFGSSKNNLTGDATPNDVQQGMTFYSNNDVKQVGTLPVRGKAEAQSLTVWQGNLYLKKIPEGVYKNRGGTNEPEIYINANTLGNAEGWCCCEGYTFTSQNGVEIAGTAPDHHDETWNVNAGEIFNIPWGHYNGTSRVKALNKPIYLGQGTSFNISGYSSRNINDYIVEPVANNLLAWGNSVYHSSDAVRAKCTATMVKNISGNTLNAYVSLRIINTVEEEGYAEKGTAGYTNIPCKAYYVGN